MLPLTCCLLVAGSAAAEFDAYGGHRGLPATATGWFRVDRFAGRWLLVTPDGHGFFSLGVTHAVDCVKFDELGRFATAYGGSEDLLSEFLLAQLADWGFNSAGYGALAAMERRVPYVATIWTEGPRSFSAGPRSAFTDVFDPAVQERLRQKVRAAAARHVDNPWCLGYVFIDLPVWHATAVGPHGGSYVDFVRGLPAEASGRQAYQAFLRQRYGEPARFSQTYGIELTNWAGLTAVDLTGIAPTSAAVADDDELFLNQLAETYYRCVVGELRSVDPHHLILGDRLMAWPDRTPDSILVTAARHVDVLSFQPMGTQRPIGGYLDHVLALTGKPALLADVNTMTSRPQRDQLDTTAYERSAGEHTLAYYLDAAASPACLGLHRCTFRDYQAWNPQYHRRGLLRADDTPYPLLVEFTRKANAASLEVVYAAAGRAGQ